MKNIRSLSKTVTQSDSDAGRHTLVCGTSDTGMSVYLLHLMRQDTTQGKKIILIDPWGDLAREMKQHMGEKAVILDLSSESAKGLCDIFHADSPQDYDKVAQNVIDLFVQIYDPNSTGVVGPRFEFAVRNVVMVLMYAGKPSFVNMHKAMVDQPYLQSLLTHVPEGPVRQYWTQQIAQTSDFHKSEILDYVVSKFGIFMQEGPLKNMFEHYPEHTDLVARSKTQDIILIDTSSVRKNYSIARVVSAGITSKLFGITQDDAREKSVYIDEINSFGMSELFIRVLEEGRRSNTQFVVSSHDLENMSALLRSKLLRFGTIVAFRQAVKDAQLLTEHFLDDTITTHSLATQKKHTFSLRYVEGDEIKISTNNSIDLDYN